MWRVRLLAYACRIRSRGGARAYDHILAKHLAVHIHLPSLCRDPLDDEEDVLARPAHDLPPRVPRVGDASREGLEELGLAIAQEADSTEDVGREEGLHLAAEPEAHQLVQFIVRALLAKVARGREVLAHAHAQLVRRVHVVCVHNRGEVR